MRLLTFSHSEQQSHLLGVRLDDMVLDVAHAANLAGMDLPATMRQLFFGGDSDLEKLRILINEAKTNPQIAKAWVPESKITYLPPITDAEKFLCVGKNYRTHLEELKRTNLIREIPEEPTGFIKLNTCLSGHKAKVVKPEGVIRLDYEPELVFVIGKRALGATKSEAFDHVVGVTVLNDLTCRDLQQREVASGSRFWTAKNIPGFGPLGPEIITMDEIDDPYNLWMVCRVNGEERMRVNTNDQIWKIPDILEHFSRFIPIEPGDMFSTGAPGGVAVGKPNPADFFLKPGDVVECGIEGFTMLSTTIIAP